jgi:hypothetical protein
VKSTPSVLPCRHLVRAQYEVSRPFSEMLRRNSAGRLVVTDLSASLAPSFEMFTTKHRSR